MSQMNSFVSADAFEAAVEASPAHKATLNTRRRKVAEHRLQQHYGVSWGTAETVSSVPYVGVPCMGWLIVFLLIQCLLLKWKKRKGFHPKASRYAARCSAVCYKVAGRVHKVYRRQEGALDRKIFQIKLYCIVLCCIFNVKVHQAKMRCKQKVHYYKVVYRKVAVTIFYRHVSTMRVAAAVIFLGLLMSGNVELNPGPKQGELTIADLKVVRSAIWEARAKWMDIGIELNVLKSDLDVLKENYGNDAGKCFTEMLSLWLQTVKPPPTWSALVTALKEPTLGLEALTESEVLVKHSYTKSQSSGSTSSAIEFEAKKLSFPHISKIVHDERTRQQLLGRLREESLDIMQDFLVLINKFFDSLDDQEVSVKRLTRYLRDAFKKTELQLSTMEDVQDFIRQKSSFFDYRLIRYMINMSGEPCNFEQLRNYEAAFLQYAKRRIYECPSKIKASCSEDEVELQVKLDLEYDQCKLEDIEALQHRLTSALEINVYCCLLSKTTEGCFELTFLIPREIYATTFPLTAEQESSLIDMKVMKIVCGDYQKDFTTKQKSKTKVQVSNDDPESESDDDGDDLGLEMTPESGLLLDISQTEQQSGASDSLTSQATNSRPRTPVRNLIFGTRSERHRHTGRSNLSSCTSTASSVKPVESDLDTTSPETEPQTTWNHNEFLLAASNGNLHRIKSMLRMTRNDFYVTFADKNGNSALHHAAKMGQLNVIKYLTDNFSPLANPALANDKQATPLHLASMHGHLNVVKFLIDTQHVDPWCHDCNKRTPFFLACQHGHLKVAKHLLRSLRIYHNFEDIVYDKDENEANVLHITCTHSQLETLKWLIDSLHCDPNTQGALNRTPLHFAAEIGNLPIMKYLIERKGCNPACHDAYKVTPLHLASVNGHLSTVKYLTLKKHCDPASRDSDNQTPLHFAILKGNLEIVDFLISVLRCDPNTPGFKSVKRTPLHMAAERGHLNIVKYLIERKGCNPVIQDVFELTPLHLASMNGQFNTVKYLILERNCDPTCEDIDNRTPLYFAALNGYLELVEFFISVGCDVKAPCFEELEQTPLHVAAESGQLSIVKYLIEETNCNPGCQDVYKSTPLHLASTNGHLNVVKYLTLERHCDPACRDSDNQTPLHVAALEGYLELVRFFVSELNCDPNTPDCKDTKMTPLHLAAERGNLHIVKYLVEEKKCNPACESTSKVTPLHVATENGHLDTVSYLILKQHCDPTCRSGDNQTPLHVAAFNGLLELVDFFITELECDPNTPGYKSRKLTPLHMAAQQGHLNVVKYLVEEKRCNPACLDAFKTTPLHSAAMNGHIDIAKYLILNRNCDPMCRDSDNQTPLHFAASNGHHSLIKFLKAHVP